MFEAPRLPAWGVPDPGEVPPGVPPGRRGAAPGASGGGARGGEEADGCDEVGRGRRDGLPAVARPGSGDHRDLGVGEHRSPRASPSRETQAVRNGCRSGNAGLAVFTRWARTGDAHLRGLGITRDGTDAFDPTQDDRDPADVTALIEDQVSDGTDLDGAPSRRPRSSSCRASRSGATPVTPVEGSSPEPEPARFPTGPGEGPARGDHRPRRRPRRQRRTSDPRRDTDRSPPPWPDS